MDLGLGRKRQRGWLIAEAAIPLAAIAAGVALWPSIPGILVYVTMAIVGGRVYPLLTVYLPHRDYGDTHMTQTRTLRGRIIPAIFLELTHHLEHHLAGLGRRLDPVLAANGVQAVRVP